LGTRTRISKVNTAVTVIKTEIDIMRYAGETVNAEALFMDVVEQVIKS